MLISFGADEYFFVVDSLHPHIPAAIIASLRRILICLLFISWPLLLFIHYNSPNSIFINIICYLYNIIHLQKVNQFPLHTKTSLIVIVEKKYKKTHCNYSITCNVFFYHIILNKFYFTNSLIPLHLNYNYANNSFTIATSKVTFSTLLTSMRYSAFAAICSAACSKSRIPVVCA